MKRLSISGRLTLAALVILGVFLGLTGFALEKAHRDSLAEAEKERLQALIYLLLGQTELDEKGKPVLPEVFAEARLSTPGSGLYAAITDTKGQALWQAESQIGRSFTYPALTIKDAPLFQDWHIQEERFRLLSYPVAWQRLDTGEQTLVFHALQSEQLNAGPAERFRRTLWFWLIAAAVALLLAMLLALTWGLRPLSKVSADIQALEAGTSQRLSDHQPRELRPLTKNFNRFIETNDNRLRRQRETMADLAHSLKTPLSVLSALAEKLPETSDQSLLEQQLIRMDQAITLHQQRGNTAGTSGFIQTINPRPVIERLIASLEKVYADKTLQIELKTEDDLRIAMDEGDLTEIFGNVLDNAYKFAHTIIVITLESSSNHGYVLQIDDDGPGFPEDADPLLARGMRADERNTGQGIGLSIVRDIVTGAYQGQMLVRSSKLGGAEVCLRIP